MKGRETLDQAYTRGTARGRFIALDPGGTTGWARFAGGELQAAGIIRFGLETRLQRPLDFRRMGVDAVIIEIPDRVEPGIPLGDVLMCARRAGCFEALALDAGLVVETVPPVRWKGTISKTLTQRRARAALSAAELTCVPKVSIADTDDMFDAIGIGLWALGRFGRGGGIFR